MLVGRCWEAGGAPAYWPWVQSLRAYVRGAEPDALRAQLGPGAIDLAQLLPELRDDPARPAARPAVESEGARFRLFDALAAFLQSAAATQPLVLVLDDLHAADEPSLLLLQFVARELAHSRILVVGAYRDVDPTLTEPLRDTLSAARAGAGHAQAPARRPHRDRRRAVRAAPSWSRRSTPRRRATRCSSARSRG